MTDSAVVVSGVTDPRDPRLRQARRLYEATLEAAERIPWQWIAGAVAGGPRSGGRTPHLLLASLPAEDGAGRVIGFAYGSYVPGLGGYACYLGVDPEERGRGVGTLLLRRLIEAMQADAQRLGRKLPLVLWESRRPGPEAGAAERGLWQARLRLFQRVGAWWVAGLTFLAPNFAEDEEEGAVPLQLFLVPVGEPAESLDARALRNVAAGLMRRIYGNGPGDPLYDATLPPSCQPRLQPVSALAASR